MQNDTIAAIATPPGLGGIAILRLSGPDARTVLSALFSPPEKSRTAGTFAFRPRHMHHGHALDRDGHPLDEVLAVYMPGPGSATGEDVGEIHCHGGAGVTAALLEAALAAGARLAGPGEFTRRAFLNGRLDLAQAEAVAELISAPTREGARLAAAKLDGSLSRAVTDLRSSLDALRIQVTLAVDFPDEEAELLDREAFASTAACGRKRIRVLLEAFERARLWSEGALAVLAGKVNAGKSSLLNALLGRPRAIVSDKPGTTRDYIEESINLKGLPLRLTDTAGLREESEDVESEGIRRTHGLAAEADILLLVADLGLPPGPDEYEFFRQHGQALHQQRLLLVLNKTDLAPAEAADQWRSRLIDNAPEALAHDLSLCPCFPVSARTGEGLDALAEGMRQAIAGSASGGTAGSPLQTGGDAAPNLRQSHLLRQADDELAALEQALTDKHPPDILSVHLEAAAACLDEVTGSTDNEELLDRIFSSFCIGK